MAVSKRRMGLALARWLGCVGFAMLCQSSFACDSVILGGGQECSCVVGGSPVAVISRDTTTGAETASWLVTQCSSASDTTCATNPAGGTSTASPQYYKHSSGYFKCDWTSVASAGAGFTNGVTYTPGPSTVSAPIIILDKPTIFSEEVK